MSAVLSPPALHQAFPEDEGCTGVTAAASPRPRGRHPRGAARLRGGPGRSWVPGGGGSRADSHAAELFPSFSPCPALGNPPRSPLHLRQTCPVCWVLSAGAELPRASDSAWAGTSLRVRGVPLAARRKRSLFAGGLNEPERGPGETAPIPDALR